MMGRIVLPALLLVALMSAGAPLALADCYDGGKDGNETDVDCGGSDCPACGVSLACLADVDCTTGICDLTMGSPGMCGDTCMSGDKNGDETDTDCGGSLCPPCSDSAACLVGSDCESGSCDGAVCQAPSCTDGKMNGDEAAVDCGGSSCGPCPYGAPCFDDGDCTTGACDMVDGTCGPAATCSNGQTDGGETAQDCGGGSCAPCGAGLACLGHLDCVSANCHAGLCGAPLTISPSDVADDLAAAAIGAGVTVTSADLIGASGACGTFVNGPLGLAEVSSAPTARPPWPRRPTPTWALALTCKPLETPSATRSSRT